MLFCWSANKLAAVVESPIWDMTYYSHRITQESCYTLQHCNIRSHRRHVNTSSQQSDEAGMCYPLLTGEELKTALASLSNTTQENRQQICVLKHTGQASALTPSQPCGNYLAYQPRKTAAQSWKVGRMEGNYKEGRMWRTLSYHEQRFRSVSGFADYSESDTWRVLTSQFN